MRVGIDITPLKNAHELRGTGVYTAELLRNLKKYAPEIEIIEFSEKTTQPKNIDLIHVPYFDPFKQTIPLFHTRPTIVTVHDLIPIAYSEHFPRGIRGEIVWQIQRRLLAGVSRIMTDSQASQDDICRFVPYASSSIDVVYLAASESHVKTVDTDVIKRVQKAYGIKDDFFIYVGDVNWNKNILGLLRAFALYQRNQPNIQLVLVGKAFTVENLTEAQKITKLIGELGIGQSIVKTGFLPQDHVCALYSSAIASLSVSFTEGFGLPILEAMSCGCPVITSNASSMKEIAGPSILINPEDISDIARGFDLAQHVSRTKWRIEAKKWLTNFSWKKTIAGVMNSYQKVLNGK